jgi:ribosomal protein S8
MAHKLTGRHSYPLSNFLHALVIAQNKKQSQLRYYNFTKSIRQHAEFLYKHGYIYGYSTFYSTLKPNIGVIVLDLKYSSQQLPLIRHVRFYSSPSRFWWIRLHQIHTLVKRSGTSQFVLSTSLGLHTELECALKKCSGLLLYKLN